MTTLRQEYYNVIITNYLENTSTENESMQKRLGPIYLNEDQMNVMMWK
jgi:hypothetical protein